MSALKGGPCGLVGFYNSVITNFLDNYDTALPDFGEKSYLLKDIAAKLTQRINNEAIQVRCNSPYGFFFWATYLKTGFSLVSVLPNINIKAAGKSALGHREWAYKFPWRVMR